MFIENTEELAQNKLLLLYLIDKSDKPLNKNIITEFMLENDHMNYFLVQQYLSELLQSNSIKTKPGNLDDEINKIYELTDKGKLILSYFIDRVNDEFKSDVSNNFIKTKKDIKKETEVLSEYYQKGNGQYVVNLKLVENEDILFSLYLDVSDKEQASKVSKQWKNNTNEIYKTIIQTLIEEK